ncbi:unnamed protein product [Camellia sinensis]
MPLCIDMSFNLIVKNYPLIKLSPFSYSVFSNMFASSTKPTRTLCKSLAISILILYIIYIISCSQSSLLFTNLTSNRPNHANTLFLSPTNVTHLVFGIASSSNTWRARRRYVESWWRPNVTQGFIFLDRTRRDFFPWPPSSPPLRISEDTSRYRDFNKHRFQQAIRVVHMVAEAFAAANDGVRWYIMTDDDTIVFVDNLVDVLRKYDHRKYFYVGANAESISSNWFHSFEMGFGGAGYALSYPLAELVVKNLDVCIKRYPTLYGSDHVMQSCIADLGVSLTQEKGFHQIDLHHDISGFLSAHPQSPLISLHHLDAFDQIFPSMDRPNSLNHLMKAAKADSSRLLQQTICYHKQSNRTFSISWGYSAHIYQGTYPPSVLLRPLETFVPWSRAAKPPYMFNTRVLSRNPCEAPHVFYFDSVDEESYEKDYVVTNYNLTGTPPRLLACSSGGNRYSANYVDRIRVLSPLKRYTEVGSRRECCDVVQEAGMNTSEVKLRACMKHELLA